MAKVAFGLALLCLLAVAFASESMGWVDELNSDSPVRQAQRERHTEREAAATAMDSVSLLESGARSHSRSRSAYSPAQNRITGATKTYHPNDNMCVMCQFLVQRVQLDMAHFNVMGQFVGAKTKSSTSTKGEETFFLQIAEGEEAEEEDEADDEDEEEDSEEIDESEAEGDMEADWVAEDREVAAALEIEAKKQLAEEEGDINALEALEMKSHPHSEEEEEGESETDQSTAAPSTTLTETASEVASGLSADEQREMEEVLRETRNDRVADTVAKEIEEGMAETPVMIESESDVDEDAEAEDEMTEEEITPDMVSNGQRKELMSDIAKSFDKDLELSSDEVADLVAMKEGKASTEDGFTSPVYNADGHADAIPDGDVVEAEVPSDNVFLQTEEEEGEEEEEESDSAMADNIEFIELGSRPHVPRRYARMLHRAEVEPVEPVVAEVSGQHAHFQSSGGLAEVMSERRGVPRPRGIGVANSPRRYRIADSLASRPRWNRFDPTVQPHPNAQRTKAREMWHRLMQMTYDRLEGYCSTRLPEQFTPFCRPLLRRFRVVAEGIRYGDRPNQICMRTKFCPKGTYVRRSPHNVFKHVATHASADP